jgi:hypothetical protein
LIPRCRFDSISGVGASLRETDMASFFRAPDPARSELFSNRLEGEEFLEVGWDQLAMPCGLVEPLGQGEIVLTQPERDTMSGSGHDGVPVRDTH